MDYMICGVSEDEKETLAQLRILAMRESLDAVGRFDPARARARFLDGFDSEATRKLLVGGDLVGFYVVKEKRDHLHLDHLYIVPEYQGKGMGASVLGVIISEARERKMPLRLGALRGSRANTFYQSHGFVQTHADDWDIYYEFRIGEKLY